MSFLPLDVQKIIKEYFYSSIKHDINQEILSIHRNEILLTNFWRSKRKTWKSMYKITFLGNGLYLCSKCGSLMKVCGYRYSEKYHCVKCSK